MKMLIVLLFTFSVSDTFQVTPGAAPTRKAAVRINLTAQVVPMASLAWDIRGMGSGVYLVKYEAQHSGLYYTGEALLLDNRIEGGTMPLAMLILTGDAINFTLPAMVVLLQLDEERVVLR